MCCTIRNQEEAGYDNHYYKNVVVNILSECDFTIAKPFLLYLLSRNIMSWDPPTSRPRPDTKVRLTSASNIDI